MTFKEHRVWVNIIIRPAWVEDYSRSWPWFMLGSLGCYLFVVWGLRLGLTLQSAAYRVAMEIHKEERGE